MGTENARGAFREPDIREKEILDLSKFEMGFEDAPFASDPVLSEALKIALDYLKASGREKIDGETEQVVAAAILSEWLAGTRHLIRLANAGIVAGQQARNFSRKPPDNLVFLQERFFDC
jgi:hypothetical protein